MIRQTFKEMRTRWKDALQILFFVFLVFLVNGIVLGFVNAFFGSWYSTFQTAVTVSFINRIFLGILLVLGYVCVPLLAFSLFKLLILDTLFNSYGNRIVPWKRYPSFFLLNLKFMLILIGLFLIWNFIGQAISVKIVLFYAALGILFLAFFVYPWMLVSHLLFWKEEEAPIKTAARFVHTHFRKASFMIGLDLLLNLLLAPVFYLIGSVIGITTSWTVTAGFNQGYALAILISLGIVNLFAIVFNQFYMFLLVKEKLK